MRARHVLGCRRRSADRGWAATRWPAWNTSIVVSVMRASTTSRIRRDGTE
jgi:hypothetical protein